MEALCRAAWDEIEPLDFHTFAVRAKRSDKSFPHPTMEIESSRRPLPAGKAPRARPGCARETERSRTHLPRRNHARPRPGVCAQNSRRGRFAGEHRGTHDMPAIGRIRFGRGRVSHDEARRAPELRTFLRHGRAAGRIVAARGERAGDARSCPINFAPSCIACRSNASSAKSCATRPENTRILLYRRMMLRIAEALARRDRALALVTGRQPGSGGVANVAQSGRGGCCGANARLPPAHRHGQNGNPCNRAKDRDVRYFLGAFSRLLPRLYAANAGASCQRGRTR